MLTVEQFKKIFKDNGGVLSGKIIQKTIRQESNKQLFAQIIKKKEVRHLLVNLVELCIYEGSLYKNGDEILFGYLDFPPIKFTDNDLQKVRELNS